MEKTIFGSERVAHLVIAAIGVLVMGLSVSYGLGTLQKPGPGLYPFVVGLIILPLGLSLFYSSRKYARKGRTLDGRERGIFLSFIGACVFWIVAMPSLGYPVVTFISSFFLAKIMKLEGWVKPLILSMGTGLFIYLLFDCWLYIDLPRGFGG